MSPKHFLLSLLAASSLALAGCVESGEQGHQAKNVAAQQTAMERATAAVPVPPTNNFVARQQLAEYMRRMDDPSKVWFVYLLGNNGNIIGYHVGSYPQSVCTFMTPPEQVEWRQYNSYTSAVTTAPALDGIYYKGGGCDTSFMFDDATNAMIFIGGLKFLAYDAPLNVDAKPISVRAKPAD